MAEVDAELLANLKKAKSKKMFFAFVPKGPSDGQLLVRPAKIAPKDVAAVKKELSGGNPITGKCTWDDSGLNFVVNKEPPATLPACIKKVVKRDTGLTVVANFQLAGDADAEEEVS